jgi:hypothetical protein
VDNDEARKLYEDMWERRKRVMDEISRKERRHEQEAIFNTLMDSKGDDHDRNKE